MHKETSKYRDTQEKYSDPEREKWLYANRNKVLSLDELFEVGNSFYGDQNLLSLYNMPPKLMFERGIRILGRTAIECSIDSHAKEIAKNANKVRSIFSLTEDPILIDLFSGSCNLLYHLSNAINPCRTIAFENDYAIYNLTKHNLEIIDFHCEFYHGDYSELISKISFPQKTVPIVLIVSPPWGKGFTCKNGLDLLATEPPVDEIIRNIYKFFSGRQIIFMIQTHEKIVPRSVNSITSKFSFFYNTLDFSHSDDLNTGFLVCG